MEALRRSVGKECPGGQACKKARKAAAGQKEMLMPISGTKPTKEAAGKKPAAGTRRKSA